MKEFWSFARDFFDLGNGHQPDIRTKYSPPSYNGERCRKCGSRSSGMKYEPVLDTLELVCHSCGFKWTKPPLDRKPSSAGESK